MGAKRPLRAFDPGTYYSYSPAEVAEHGLATVGTLRVWRARTERGTKGPAYFCWGSRIVYRGDDLNAWIEAHRIDPNDHYDTAPPL